MKSNKRVICIALLMLTTAECMAQHDYKVSRNLLRKQEFQEAYDVLQKKIASSPDDSEWVYQMAIAQAHLGKLADALASVNKARKMGVTPGRFAADSHDLLKPLLKEKEFARFVATQTWQAIQGPMVGSVTDTSAKIWLRTSEDSHVMIEVRDGNRSISVKETFPSAKTDFTTVVTFDGLEPDHEYQYYVYVESTIIDIGGVPLNSKDVKATFRTHPAPGKPVTFSFAFGGGAGYVPKHERMWDTIRSFNPNALLLLGDNIYSDDPKSSQMQRFCYYRRQSPIAFRKLVARTAVYSIWDDHDFGTNDCSGGPETQRPEWKTSVWNVFKQNWVNPGYGSGAHQPGCWYDFHVGDIHFIMLDGRYYRHHDGKTMLGPVQKDWLKRIVKTSTATFKVIASPVPWDFRTKGKSKDTWNGFREERKEIFDFLADNKIAGVILISADRHRSDAWKIDRPNGYSLYEFNSSRLTNNHMHREMKQAIFSYNKKQSFGLVEFDTIVVDPTVSYQVINIDGEKVHNLKLRRSQLE